MTRYPEISVQLYGKDGDARAIVARCRDAARRAGLSTEDITAFTREAFSGDYDTVIQTCLRWFHCR